MKKPVDPSPISERVHMLAAMVDERPEILQDAEFIRNSTWSILGGPNAALPPEATQQLESLVRMLLQETAQNGQLIATLHKMHEHLAESPQLARVLSEPFDFGSNGRTRRVIYVAAVGAGPGRLHCVSFHDDTIAPPPLLSYCFIDGEAQFYLDPAEDVPVVPQEHQATAAEPEGDVPELGQVTVQEGPDRHLVLYCEQELAELVADRLAAGETVTVRHDGMVVTRLVESKAENAEPWLEFPELDGPDLEEMVFPPSLAKEWEKDIRRILQGRSVRVLLIGDTGVGKTEAVLRAARRAASRSARRLAMIRLSLSHIGSSYYSETEKTIPRIIQRAKRLNEEGYCVVMLLDEADAILGNSEGRFEGSVDRRVRMAFQEHFGGDNLPGIPVYLTMNPRSDSWLPAALARRFRPRAYPRTQRTQMARVAASYASQPALDALEMTAGEFGQRIADYLYADAFTVARVWMHSGRSEPVRCRDLRQCSPGKIKDLVVDFCEEVESGDAVSLEAFWPMVEREFRGVFLNENNLYELTLLPRPASDSPRKVEPVRHEPASEALCLSAVG